MDTPQGELQNIDTSHIYHGQVLGEPNSHVFGSLIDGVFEGKIITDTHAYYVEHAKRYFPNQTHLDYGFHSIIYNERDVVDDPFANERKPNHANGCGISEDVAQWMDSVQNAAIDDDNEIVQEPIKEKQQQQQKKPVEQPKLYRQNSIFMEDHMNSPYLKYSKEANSEDNYASNFHGRSKRAARPKEDNKNTCSLYIQTDPLIWRHIREGIADVSRKQNVCLLSFKNNLHFY